MTDPVYYWIMSLSLAALWSLAAIGKLRSPTEFAQVLNAYQILPRATTSALSRAIPGMELALALLLISPWAQPAAALASASLFALYGAAMGINLLRGRREIDCGCHLGRKKTIGWPLVARNAALASVSLILLLPQNTRPLASADILLIAAFCFVAGLLFVMLQTVSNLGSTYVRTDQ
jgi:hypothetical protein